QSTHDVLDAVAVPMPVDVVDAGISQAVVGGLASLFRCGWQGCSTSVAPKDVCRQRVYELRRLQVEGVAGVLRVDGQRGAVAGGPRVDPLGEIVHADAR